MDECIAIAEMKNHLSEYIARSAYNKNRFIITKRNKPVAALVNIEDLKIIEQHEEKKGLASIIGKWDDFEDLENNLGDTRELRKNGGNAREISL